MAKPETIKEQKKGLEQEAATVLPPKLWPWLAVGGGAAVLIMVVLGSVAYAMQSSTIVRNVTVAGQDIGGLDTLTALHRVQTQWTIFTTKAFTFTSNGKSFKVPVGPTGTGDEVVIDLVSLDAASAVNQAFDYGHRGTWWTKARERLSGWLGREHTFGKLLLDRDSLATAIKNYLDNQERSSIDAGLNITSPTSFLVTESAVGQTFDYAGAVQRAHRNLLKLRTNPIPVTTVTIQPDVPMDPDLLLLAQKNLPSLLAQAPVTITDGEKHWTIDQTALMGLIGFSVQNKITVLSLDQTKVSAWLDKIKKEAETQPQNAKFGINGEKVEAFQASVVGRLINAPETIATWRNDIITEKKSASTLVMAEVRPVTDTNTTNNLGITELVAEGTTNFHGSPTNRRFNLSYGTQKLNGLLIAPGETFSLITALGKIDQKHGWKSELVIKGTEITPEFGGGLCQVATTLFRTVLNAGLPVVERHNHSLRIRYYEPPIGLDATIYEPKPDLRFTNDYTHYLLLQTEVDGDNLTYRFYGTKDGRTVDIPEPKVYNRTGIPPTKNVEVDDLKPGEKKCQTPGHPGADATATYTVTKADGTKVTQTFQSHYRPLPVICQVGKAKATTATKKPAGNTNTNTPT